MNTSSIMCLLLLMLLIAPAWAQPAPPVGTWVVLPNTVLWPAMPPEAKSSSVPGGRPELWSPFSPMAAFSGGDIVQVNGIWGFLIWGGGHGDGADNSLYFIPFDGSGPRALMGPYLAPAGVSYFDGGETYLGVSRNQPPTTAPGLAPKARHTYSSILALRDRQLAWAYGGSLTSGSGGGTAATRTFDLTQTHMQAMARPDMGWERPAMAPAQSVTSSSGYDEKRRVVVTRGTTFWGVYNPDTKTWTRLGDSWGGSDFPASVAVDSEGRKLWILGSYIGEVIDLDSYRVTQFMRKLSGDVPPPWTYSIASGYEWAKIFQNATAGPGVAWHPRTKQLVVWLGGNNLILVDPVGNTTRTVPMGGTTVSAPALAGTYGRFRLIPGTDTVVVVNSVEQNVFLGSVPFDRPPR